MPSKPNRHPLQPVFFREQSFVGIVHHEAAALDGRDILVGMEAEGDEITDRTDAPPVHSLPKRLGGVLDDPQAVLLGDPVELIAVDGQPRKIHGRMARVTLVMARSIRVKSMLRVAGSMSTKTGRAPTSRMTLELRPRRAGW